MDTSQQSMNAALAGAGVSRVGTKSGKSAGDVKDARTNRAKGKAELAKWESEQPVKPKGANGGANS